MTGPDDDGTGADEPPEAGEPKDRLARLRAELSAETSRAVAVMPLGHPVIDAHLPCGGLSLGPPHEIVPAEPVDAIAALAFALALCARRLAEAPGEAMIASSGHPLPYGHGLASLGLDPGRLLLLEAGGDGEVFRALEAALHANCLSALIGLVGEGMPLKAGRRLQLAAETGEPPLLLVLRRAGPACPTGRPPAGASPPPRPGPTASAAFTPRAGGCGSNGAATDAADPGCVEWDSAANRLHLPERLADDAAAAGRARP